MLLLPAAALLLLAAGCRLLTGGLLLLPLLLLPANVTVLLHCYTAREQQLLARASQLNGLATKENQNNVLGKLPSTRFVFRLLPQHASNYEQILVLKQCPLTSLRMLYIVILLNKKLCNVATARKANPNVGNRAEFERSSLHYLFVSSKT